MNRFTTRAIAHAGITAALYTAITAVLAPISFGPVQLRLAELLNLMAFFSPVYAVGVTLGCFFSNTLFSEFGLVDIVVGTACTGVATFLITKTKSLFIASLWPVLLTLPVAAYIAILLELPYIPTALSVMAGEFIVVVICGYPLFRVVKKYFGVNAPKFESENREE